MNGLNQTCLKGKYRIMGKSIYQLRLLTFMEMLVKHLINVAVNETKVFESNKVLVVLNLKDCCHTKV